VHRALFQSRFPTRCTAAAALALLAGLAVSPTVAQNQPASSEELSAGWYAKPAPTQGADLRDGPAAPVQIESEALPRRVTTFARASRLSANAAVELPGGALQPADPAWDEMVLLPAFTEPVEITALIDFVQQALEINIAMQGDPAGQIVLNAPIEIPKSRLLRLLGAMLDRFDYTIVWDEDAQLYVVQEKGTVGFESDGPLATAKIIRTPNIKPSLIQPALSISLGLDASSNAVQAIDELGVLVVMGSPKLVRMAQTVIDEFAAAAAEMSLHRIELTYIAASTARDRAIGLTGSSSAQGSNQGVAQAMLRGQMEGNQLGGAGLAGGTLDNLADRLTVDATGNALLFRGVLEELEKVVYLIELIDVPNTLTAKNYFAGASAQQIADIAKSRGLGEVIILEADSNNSNQQFQFQFNGQGQGQGGGAQQPAAVGGPVMVVDIERGSIIYYGTEAQQEELTQILDDIKSDDDRVVIRSYKVKHGKAEDIAATLDGIISGTQQTGDSSLLPETRVGGNARQNIRPVFTDDGVAFVDGSGNDVSGDFDPNEVIVIADVPNNQIIARAPIRQQEELSRLIDQLDLRRKQVYVEVLIISVSDSSNFRLAVETQILNGQYGVQTNFGLSGAGADFQSQRSVASNLAGFTSALIQSESIPFIINAMQTDTDARILSKPTLLVNDNEEGSIDSVEEQPTTSTSQTDSSTVTSFQGFEEAGTNLRIVPTISKDGYLTLEYDITRSNFTGAGQDGVPAPRATNTVTSKVTVPSNTTIVVGGIKTENLTDTIEKIPLLGDIPLLGILFQDRVKIKSSSVLYIFITPKIMSDPSFRDLKLITKGPQAEVDVEDLYQVPELNAVLMPPASVRPLPLPSTRQSRPVQQPPADDQNDENGQGTESAAVMTSEETNR
jgi:type II secretory pathway component GspD/PulD (secretin)